MRLLCLIGLAALLAAPASGGDKDKNADRARKVKVALALAEAKPAPKDDARTAKVAAALEAAGFPSPSPFVTVPTVAPAPMPREVSVLPCDCLTTGECACGAGCRCRAEAEKGEVKIVKRPTWHADYNAALKVAAGKTMVVLFTDPKACVPCRKLEAGALADPAVRDQLATCVCVRIDVTTDYGRGMLAFFAAHRDPVSAWPSLKVYKAGVRVADWHASPGEDVTADVLLTLIR